MNSPSLHICIDIRPLETGGRHRGYGYYVRSLIRNVLKSDKTNRYSFIVYGEDNPLSDEIRKKGFKIFPMKRPNIRPRLWWILDQMKLPGLIGQISPDIYVSLDTSLPLLTFSKKFITVVAVHDLIPLVLEQEYKLPFDRRLDFNLKMMAAKRSDGVLTISKYSMKELEKYLKIPVDRLKYIYEASDQNFTRSSSEKIDALRRKHANGKKYIITVGDLYGSDPRKNYLFLLNCFSRFITEEQDNGLMLLFVGKCGGKNNEYSRIKERAAELGIQEKIAFTDFVSDEDLAGLYSGSEAFVYPTKYEGFGLPILQAMSCGCPVVAANNTSIPEVAGEAAELFATNDQQSFLNALKKVLTHRERYRKLGYENIKRFSWEKSAREFINYLNNFGKHD